MNHLAEAARSSAAPALPKSKTLLQLPPHGRAGVSAASAETGQAELRACHQGSASSPYEPSEARQDRHDEHTGQFEQEMQIQQVEQPIAQEGGKHIGQHAMCSQGITTPLPELEVSQAAQKAVHSLFLKTSVQVTSRACEEIAISRKHQKFSEAAAPVPDADQAWLQRISAAATMGTCLDDDTQDFGSGGAHLPTAPAAAATIGMRDGAGAADPSSTHTPKDAAAAATAMDPNNVEGNPGSSIEYLPEAPETPSAPGAAALSTGQTSSTLAAAGSGSHAQPPVSISGDQVMHLMQKFCAMLTFLISDALPCRFLMQGSCWGLRVAA